jgi:hypothetical protein
MRPVLVLLFASLMLVALLSTTAVAGVKNPTTISVQQERIVIHLNVKALPHQAVSLLAGSVKHAAKFTGSVPREVGAQMQAGTDNAQVAFRAATGQTQSTFQRLSGEVAALSLHVLRSASSYFLALLSGLMR